MHPKAAREAQHELEEIAIRSKGFVLPKDNTITLSVIGGPSKGLAHQFRKPRISIGRAVVRISKSTTQRFPSCIARWQ